MVERQGGQLLHARQLLHAIRRTENAEKLFIGLMVGLIVLAWLALAIWGQSPYGRFLNHQHLAEVSLSNGSTLLVFVAGWTLMSAAMMLPTSLPLVTMFQRLVLRRPERTRLVMLLIAGYLAVWTLFGALIHIGDWGLHHATEQIEWLHANAYLVGAATLLLAGLYQFAPLKYRCLDRCRSPFSFIVEHWQGRHEAAQALWLGIDHGLFCLGCCWSLMLLMFAVGTGNLGWMLALGAVMAVEKNAPWGRRLTAPLGVSLMIAGLVVALRARAAL